MKDEYSEMIPKISLSNQHHREIRETLYGLKGYEKPKKKRYKFYCKHDNCKQGLVEDNIAKSALNLTEEQEKAHREFQSRLFNTFFIECKCD
jgi:hypothetical protein